MIKITFEAIKEKIFLLYNFLLNFLIIMVNLIYPANTRCRENVQRTSFLCFLGS